MSGQIRGGYGFLVSEISCVYIIRCIENGSVYIGQTKADLKREAEHFTELRKGIHHNYKLQADYDKYGDEKFFFQRIRSYVNNDKLRLWLESDYIIRAKEREINGGYKIYNIVIPKRENIGYQFKLEDDEFTKSEEQDT